MYDETSIFDSPSLGCGLLIGYLIGYVAATLIQAIIGWNPMDDYEKELNLFIYVILTFIGWVIGYIIGYLIYYTYLCWLKKNYTGC